MKSIEKIRVITVVIAIIISSGATYVLDGYMGTDLFSYAIFLFLVLQSILEIGLHKVRVSKLDKCLEKVEWNDSTSRHPVLFYGGLFALGLIASLTLMLPDWGLIILTVYFGVIALIEYKRHKEPMEIYKEGIYVNGYFARFGEIEIEKGDSYIEVVIPCMLGKIKATVSVKEDIEKLERVVYIEEV